MTSIAKKYLLIIIGTMFSMLYLCIAQTGQFTIPGEYPDQGITIIDRNVGDNDWSADGKLIAYTKMNPADKYFQVYVIKPDGTGQKCLTCGAGFPHKHNANVTWYPSGEYIVFTAENEDVQGERADKLTRPGIGLNCNLWAMKSDGSVAWPLTHFKTDNLNPKGVIHPQFSHDGTKLIWAEAIGKYAFSRKNPGKDQPYPRRAWRRQFRDNKMLANKNQNLEWGEWQIAIANFIISRNGNPELSNIKRIQPGTQHGFYETHNFSKDNTKILFSGNLAENQPVNGLDIWELDLTSNGLTRLTDTFYDWDEHAHYSPDGALIAWMSGKDLHVKIESVREHDWLKFIKTELWLMKKNGSEQRRLTYFNQPASADHKWADSVLGSDRIIVSDTSWGPDGKKLAATIAYEGPEGNLRSILVIMDLTKRMKWLYLK